MKDLLENNQENVKDLEGVSFSKESPISNVGVSRSETKGEQEGRLTKEAVGMSRKCKRKMAVHVL